MAGLFADDLPPTPAPDVEGRLRDLEARFDRLEGQVAEVLDRLR